MMINLVIEYEFDLCIFRTFYHLRRMKFLIIIHIIMNNTMNKNIKYILYDEWLQCQNKIMRMFWNYKKWNIETTNKYSLFLFGFKIMPTEVALDFSNDVGLLLLVDVPALFVVFCFVEAVCKKFTNNSKRQKNQKRQTKI